MTERGKRRRNGDGTIYQRKDGRWVAELYVPMPDGTTRRKPLYGKDRTEVEGKLAAARKAAKHGIPFVSGTLTVRAYLTEWLDQVASKRVRANTLMTYRTMVTKYLIPGLGRKSIGRLTAREVRQFLDGLTKNGAGPRTVQYAHTILRTALEDAVREETIPRNVAKLVRIAPPPKRERQPLTVDQVMTLLRYTRDYRNHALFVVLALLGLRRSEALALTWNDIDLSAGILRVRGGLQRTDAGLVVLDTKTRRSARAIPLPSLVLAALRDHWYQRQLDHADLDGRYRDTGYVFTTPIGTPIDPRNCTRLFQDTCADAGLPVVRLHDLRHGCASVLLTLGVPPRTVMEILGHATLEMTMNTYAHVTLDDMRAALGKFDHLIAL